MASMSEFAIRECVAELRAACRPPIDEAALETLLTLLRPNFREILDGPEGKAHWTDHGRQIRDNSRYLGALADFCGCQGDVAIVGTSELMQAFTMVAAACSVGAPVASEPVLEAAGKAPAGREPV